MAVAVATAGCGQSSAPQPPPSAQSPAATTAKTSGSGGPPCTLPADVLPVPADKGEKAEIVQAGAATWIISGLIYRCAETGSSSVAIQTPAVLGVTAAAAVQLSVTGVKLWPESEATENKPTAWRLTSAPTIRVTDPANTDPSKNVLTLGWGFDASRIVSYELAYTIYLTQST